MALLPVGCASNHPATSLSVEQATAIALRLANEKTFTLYHCQPFQDGQPAKFFRGHWSWTSQPQGYGPCDLQAQVALAADGSTNNVDVQLLDNRRILQLRSMRNF